MRFDRKAAQYHEKADIQKLVADWGAEWIERDCQGLKALELGAGTGLLTRHLALRGFDPLIASDLSEQMLDEGRKRLPIVRWERLDAWGTLPHVDRIYASSLLQWAPDPVAVLKNWNASLESGGRALDCLFAKGSLKEFVTRRSEFAAFPWRRKKEWNEHFESAGFRVLRVESRKDVVSYESAREALRAIHDVGAIRERRMGPGALRRFLDECDRATAGSFELSWRALRIECEKV